MNHSESNPDPLLITTVYVRSRRVRSHPDQARRFYWIILDGSNGAQLQRCTYPGAGCAGALKALICRRSTPKALLLLVSPGRPVWSSVSVCPISKDLRM
jgi:hypothetical protein